MRACAIIDRVNAETAYLFRHALARDAAYQLQLPGDRSRLHALAFAAIEELAGGRPPAAPPLTGPASLPFRPHSADAFAADLAEHAARAQAGSEAAEGGEMDRVRRLYVRRAAEHAERLGHPDAAEKLWCEHAALADGPERGESLRRAGYVLSSGGWANRSHGLLVQALELLRRSGDRKREGAALTNLAGVLLQLGRNTEAERHYEAALALYRESGDSASVGATIANLAGLDRALGRMEPAERRFEEALGILHGCSDRRIEAVTMANLAIHYRQTGRPELAESTFTKALALHRKQGDRRSEGVALGNMANLHQDAGRPEEAERCARAALAIHREVGNHRSEGIVLGSLGNILDSLGRQEEAGVAYRQALGTHREVGNRRSEGVALGDLGVHFRETGQLGLSREHFDQALAIHRETGNRRYEGVHLCEAALLDLAERHAECARDRWRKGHAILLALGDSVAIRSLRAGMHSACARAAVTPFDSDPA